MNACSVPSICAWLGREGREEKGGEGGEGGRMEVVREESEG